jgi:cyanophycinase-like exopeptidase
MRLTTLFTATILTVTTLATPVDTTNTTTIGPENGHLVIIGGNLRSEPIYQRIISLAGGPNAPLVVIPTAGGDPTYDDSFTTAANFREYGATNVTVLHTYNPLIADTEFFVAPLREAKGIFFAGGRQWSFRQRRCYSGE